MDTTHKLLLCFDIKYVVYVTFVEKLIYLASTKKNNLKTALKILNHISFEIKNVNWFTWQMSYRNKVHYVATTFNKIHAVIEKITADTFLRLSSSLWNMSFSSMALKNNKKYYVSLENLQKRTCNWKKVLYSMS